MGSDSDCHLLGQKKIIKAKSGSILLFNSNLWHCGGANKSGAKRAVFNVIYRKRLLPQGLNQKKYLSKKTKNKMNALEQYLYRIRKNDKNQKVKIYGPGKDYRDFLIKNPKFQYNVTPT